jgi:branched-chain amino acid aminotransferase
MKMIDGEIILKKFHFERLFAGMDVLNFVRPKNFTASFLFEKINELCKKNHHCKCARVRLTIFRGNGGLYDAVTNDPNYIIETWNIENKKELNSNGLIVDVYPDAKKSCDKFSNIKSNNFLPYVMAALHAKKNKLNDSILLNPFERICDSTVANIFIIKKQVIYTPPLTEGCIAGVMRRWILENLSPHFQINEIIISQDDLRHADEVFLTNSIYDMRWVKHCVNATYTCALTKQIHKYLIQTIY